MRAFELGRDLHYAVRLLRRTPAFTLPAVFSLALAIAVNTVLFSVVNATLLRPLGGRGNGELVRLGRGQNNDGGFRSLSYDELLHLREHAASFDGIAGGQLESLVLTGSESAEIVSTEPVTANYFSVIGIQPALGRGFLAEEDAIGAGPVTIISDRFWRRAFGGDPAVIGRTLTLNNHKFTIVGVGLAGFFGTFPGVAIDLWLPVGMMDVVLNRPYRETPTLGLMARLKPDGSIDAARTELQLLAERLRDHDPERYRNRSFSIASARGIHPGFARIVRAFLLLLMAVVAVVLVIACTNVAGLLLARANARQTELAVRFALGAGRARVAQQLLVESGLLALLGGLAGLLLALWPVQLLNRFSITGGPTGSGIFFDLRVDGRVLFFTAAITMLTTVLFGLAPALQATRRDLVARLKDVHSAFAPRRARFRSGLMIGQVALSCLLLVIAVLLLQSVRQAGRVELGFDPQQVVVATLDLRVLGADRQRTETFYTELLERVRLLPGVERAAFADFIPGGDAGAGKFRVGGMAPPPDVKHFEVPYGVISEGYFATVRQPLLRGRDFTPNDREGSPPVAIVNESFQRRVFPGEDALGQRLRLATEDEREYEVVGVAKDARFWSLAGDIEPLVLVPALQHHGPPLILHVRTPRHPSDALLDIKRVVQEIDGNVPFTGQTMREGMDFTLIPVRIAQIVFGISGIIALLLATTGLYGLVCYSLEQRIREIGIRVALGATRPALFRVIVGSAVRLTVFGVAIGTAVAAAASRLLSALVFGVNAADPQAFGAIATLLIGVALAAGYMAARKGLNLDPLGALRHE